MFDYFRAKVYPDKFRSIPEREAHVKSVHDKISSIFSERTFKILLVPPFSRKNEMMKITDWREDIGNVVEVDDILASCESRKAMFDLTATERGVLVFRIDKGTELMRDDIYAVLADKFIDLKQLTF
jgi:hypothetical protein